MRSAALPFSVLIFACVFAQASAQLSAYPLPQAAGNRNVLEDSAPFLVSAETVQRRITNRNILTPQGLPSTFGTWDMVTFGPNSRYIFRAL